MVIKKGVWFCVMAILNATIMLYLLSPLEIADASKDKIVEPVPQIPPILQKIAICESHNHQFNADGSVHMGKINKLDTGKWQINQKYWLKKSRELGYDIFTLEGNTKMAVWIYKNYGVSPWTWSRSCWGKK